MVAGEKDGTRACEIRDRAARLEDQVEEAKGALAIATELDQKFALEVEDLRSRVQKSTTERDSASRSVGTASVEESRVAHDYAMLRREADRLRFDQRHLSEQTQAGEAETSRLAGDIERARSAVEELTGILEDQTERVRQAEAARPEPYGSAVDLTGLRARLSASLATHERALARLEQRMSERDLLDSEIQRELQVAPESLPEAAEDVPTPDEIRRLRSRAAQYADADESVVRECEEIEERFTHLSTHLEDLQAARAELQTIMDGTDREMGTRFDVALRAVDDEFSRMFRVMLRGGEASLERVDADGGIGIRAQLPGKRAQSSSAFSGGERALVATSLLFGVLNIRPTPFCVLDEVDAPLDESNVDRYLAALRDISERTQMIVVTHNRATMAAADVLYGVTMDDEGVTDLLSLRLDAYEAAV
jgi:chromosome segregation protein